MINNSSTIKKTNYSREDAVRYAINYALQPNPAFKYITSINGREGDSTNFLSQCLRAGGAKMCFEKSNPWWYKNKNLINEQEDSWSKSWVYANSLFKFLIDQTLYNNYRPKGIEIYDINLLEPGDIIMYENSQSIIHSSIVTGFNYERNVRCPLVSQHDYNGLNVSYLDFRTPKLHFIKIVV